MENSPKLPEAYQKILREKAKEHQATSTGGNNPHLLENSPKADTDRINTRKQTAQAAKIGVSEEGIHMNYKNVQMVKALKVTDDLGRVFFKVRAYVLQELDLKTFRSKQDAQDYLNQVSEQIATEGTDTVIVSEL